MKLTPQGTGLLALTVCSAQLPLMFHLPVWITIPMMAILAFRVFAQSVNTTLTQPIITGFITLAAAVAIYLSYGHIIGRDPCIAFLFVLTTFKFAETKVKKDADLLILLCLFLSLTQFFYWQSIAAAALAVPAVISVSVSLIYLQRLPLATSGKAMLRTSTKLLLQGMPLAVILFLAVPRMQTGGWGNSGVGTTGLSDRLSIGSVTQLIESSEVAMRVEFDQQVPEPALRYWRGPVLSGYDGINWFAIPAQTIASTARGKPESLAVHDSRLRYTVTLSPNYQRWLPVLDMPASLPVLYGRSGRESITTINHELVSFAPRAIRKATRYQAESLMSRSFSSSIAPGPEYLITTQSNPLARTFAQQLRGQYSDDEALIHALLKWFNDKPFRYTLTPQSLPEANAIDEFFFGTQEGFCEHFASSFVFMLRAAGIPARIVTGYQGGELNENYLIVRQRDAHAWTEAWIDGEWQRFDPTAAVAPERVETGTRMLERMNDQSALHRLVPKSLILKWDALNYRWQQLVIDFDNQSRSYLLQWLGISRLRPWMLVAALFALILLPTVLLTRDRKTANRTKSALARQWRLAVNEFTRAGMAKLTSETPAAYIGRLQRAFPQASQPLQRLLAVYENGHYGPTVDADDKSAALKLKRLRAEVRKTMGNGSARCNQRAEV